MTRWKKNETEFSVSVSNDGSDGLSCRIPKPIGKILGKPQRIKFVVKGDKISIIGD